MTPLWRQREFMLLWGGQVVSSLGSHASGMVVPLLILSMTNSPSAVGLATALVLVPYILLSLPVGVWVDRWDRQRVMVYSDLGRAAASLSVLLALALDALTLPHLYLVMLVQGTGFNWAWPDHFRIVFLPHEDDLREAIGRVARFLEQYRKRCGTE